MITPFQVLINSGASRDYPTALFCKLIPQIEQEFVRTCLGSDLWDYLKSKLTPIPDNVVTWNRNDVYMEDDTVDYYGTLFTSVNDNNATEPSYTDDWTEFAMFTDAACNTLWDLYLVNILAMKVFDASLARTTLRVTSGGVTPNTGDGSGFRSGKMDEIQRFRGDIQKDIERTTTNMVEWLENTAFENGLPLPTICAGNNCKTTGKNNRRWNFRTGATVINSDWT